MSDPANLGIYRNVLVLLLVATALTVLVSYVDFADAMGEKGPDGTVIEKSAAGKAVNIVIGLIIACVKATAVILFFMHLKYEQRWWAGIVLFCLVLFAVIVFANMPDTGMNQGEPLEWGFTTPAVKSIGGAGSAH